MKTLARIITAAFVLVSVYCISGCTTPHPVTGVHYMNPAWAPPYYENVRYYYLPDIEAYYDLRDEEFVYLDNGQWLFAPGLPAVYRDYDLYNGFVIALDIHVFQPWLHHEFYVSHYPRYYYHSFYRNEDVANMRGFNENERKPIYWKPNERDKANDLKRNDHGDRKTATPHQPQPSNYYGKKIGQPVHVQPQMRESKLKKKRGS